MSVSFPEWCDFHLKAESSSRTPFPFFVYVCVRTRVHMYTLNEIGSNTQAGFKIMQSCLGLLRGEIKAGVSHLPGCGVVVTDALEPAV